MMFDATSISVQLYSVRDALKQDFEGTIRALAGWGFRAFETAGEFGGDVHKAKALFDELGVKTPSAHSGLPLGDNKNAILDTMAVLGCRYLVCPYFSPDEYFANMDGVKRACDLLNEANAVARANGLVFGYHNHWFEMPDMDGKPIYRHMLDLLDPSIVFELDTYWVKVGGRDPVQVMAELDGRLPLLHIKDGSTVSGDFNMLAVGSGKANIPAIINASKAEWHVIELDACATDMMTAVKQSYDYLKGLAQ